MQIDRRRLGTALVAAGLVLSVQCSAHAQPAGSKPAGPVNPTVQAAEQTRVQGDVPSDLKAVPQVVLPLRRAASEMPASAAGTATPVDDAAARCLAREGQGPRGGCPPPAR